MSSQILSGWNGGVFEQEAGDTKVLPRDTLARGSNFRLDRTGGVSLRRGITSRAIGLPTNLYRVHIFKNASKHALIACDGKTVRYLDNNVWTSIGTFTNTGTGATFATARQRLYIANGIDQLKVLDWTGSWNLRDAGVAAPAAAAVVTFGGGAGTTFGFKHSYTEVDDRGFESNAAPLTVTAGSAGGTFTIGTFSSPASSTVSRRIYSTLRDQQKLQLIATIPVGTASYGYSAANEDRDARFPMPTATSPGFEHDVPPAGIKYLAEYYGFVFGLSFPGLEAWCGFSAAGEPEYWPQSFRFDLTADFDSSLGRGFGRSDRGLQMWRTSAASLLRGNPQFNTAPQPMMNSAGLLNDDAIAGLNGIVYALTQRGIVAHDGQDIAELWHKIFHSSNMAILANDQGLRVVAASRDTSMHFFFRNQDDNSKIRDVVWNTALPQRWTVDDYTVYSFITTTTDDSLDFTSDADVSLHENVESGTQTISSGGNTVNPILSGTNSSKLVAGCAIKFVGFAQVHIITTVVGQTLFLDLAAPTDGTAVEWIRGTVVVGGSLTLYGGAQ